MSTARTWRSGDGGGEAGYVVFSLRESYPHTLLTKRCWHTPRRLRNIEPVDGPADMRMLCRKPDYALLRSLLSSGLVEQMVRGRKAPEIEIVGNELFLLYGAFLPLHSPRLWQRMAAVGEAVAPFLATDVPAGAGKAVVLYEK
ncbi:hypothetical protein [Streptomyces sp. NPDC056061]|uniref:hypothetical protein n=1 Tax=Streptomyces sp. NPDC056061 TaxID=3345700 RepID=UPI0035E39200